MRQVTHPFRTQRQLTRPRDVGGLGIGHVPNFLRADAALRPFVHGGKHTAGGRVIARDHTAALLRNQPDTP